MKGVRLQGAVVAITGASAGIGWESALAFARAGAKLALGARRRDRLDELVRRIEGEGGEAMAVPVDVGEKDQVAAFVAAITARWSRLDVFVNNAGFGVRGRVEDTPAGAFERQMRVNYLGTVYGCQAAVPVMRRQGAGVIINVSSIVGHRALPTGAAYAASKAAQVSLTESLRVELRGSGIAVCSVHPVGTSTEFAGVLARESGIEQHSAMGPQQTAASVAAVIVRCARRPRAEVYPYAPARLIVWANALVPGLVDWAAAVGSRRAGRV